MNKYNKNEPAKKKLAMIAPSVGQTYCSIISLVDGIRDNKAAASIKTFRFHLFSFSFDPSTVWY
jgi:hypothetical protein